MTTTTTTAALTAIAAIGITGLSALHGAAPAHAQTCDETHRAVTDGSFQWGVRDTWRDYLTGRIAQGGWNLNKVTYANSAFGFTATGGAATEASAAEVAFQGSLNFYGHKGALDMTLSDLTLRINGTRADVVVDYVTYESDFQTAGVKGDKITGDDETIATITLARPADFTSGSVDLAGTTTLTRGGADLFGAYDAGARMDPTRGKLTLADACGSAGGAGGTATGDAPRSGATTGTAGLLGQVNDTLTEVNGLLVNTDQMLTNTDALHERVWQKPDADNGTGGGGAGAGTATGGNAGADSGPSSPAAGGQAGGNSGNSGAAGTARPGGAGAAAPSAGAGTGAGAASSPAGSTAAGEGAAATGSGGACEASASRGVTSAQAVWGVRESFRNYISGSIAKGGWELDGVGYGGGQFQFTGASGAVDPQAQSGTILFPGSIRFTGHGGVLDTRLSNLEVQFSGGAGSLVVDASSNSVDGDPQNYGRIALATLSFDDMQLNDSSVRATAAATLTEVGAAAFGDFYPAGEALDPITFTAQLGGEAACADGQGAAAASAGGGSGGGAAAAAELMAAGEGDDADGENLFDEMTAGDANGGGGASNGDGFQIKSAGIDPTSMNVNNTTLLLLLGAAFVVAAAATSPFLRRRS